MQQRRQGEVLGRYKSVADKKLTKPTEAPCVRQERVLQKGLGDRTVVHQETTESKAIRQAKLSSKEDVTIAHQLKAQGYVTGGIGKWGLGNSGSEGQPDYMGFDHWYGYLDQVHAHDHFTDHLWDDGTMIDISENRDGKKGVYVHDLFEEKTMAFIQDNKAKPFFLYLAYTLPHGKYEIPEDDPSYIMYKDKPWTQQVKNYAAMITKADATVGKMMELRI